MSSVVKHSSRSYFCTRDKTHFFQKTNLSIITYWKGIYKKNLLYSHVCENKRMNEDRINQFEQEKSACNVQGEESFLVQYSRSPVSRCSRNKKNVLYIIVIRLVVYRWIVTMHTRTIKPKSMYQSANNTLILILSAADFDDAFFCCGWCWSLSSLVIRLD